LLYKYLFSVLWIIPTKNNGKARRIPLPPPWMAVRTQNSKIFVPALYMLFFWITLMGENYNKDPLLFIHLMKNSIHERTNLLTMGGVATDKGPGKGNPSLVDHPVQRRFLSTNMLGLKVIGESTETVTHLLE
jgi:hypothetical protein